MRYSRHYSDSFIGDAIGLVLFIIIFIVIILFDRVEKKKNRERCDSIKDFAEHSGLKYVESVDGFPSRYVFKFLPFGGGMTMARRLHILGAYWGFLFMSLHLGIHWNMILKMMRKYAGIKGVSKVHGVFVFFAGLFISVYGVCVFISRDFPTYLLLKSEFVFLDYSEPKFSFYIDYFALMGLCIFIAHYGIKIIRRMKKQREG